VSSLREAIEQFNQRLGVTLAPAIARYQSLSALEHLIVLSLAWLIVIVLVFALVVMPVYRWQQEKQLYYQNQLDLVTWMKGHAGAFDQNTANLPRGQTLQTVVIRDANRSNIKLQRYEPKGNSQLRVWVNQVGFKALMDWLASLQQQYGVVVSEVSVDHKPSAPGTVKATVVLSR